MDVRPQPAHKIMENPTPFDLNEAIRRWQHDLAASPAFCADNLEELASHLRASVLRLKAAGVPDEEAFQVATLRMGEQCALEREFAKVNTQVGWSWREIYFWAAAAIMFEAVTSSLTDAVKNYALLSNRTGYPYLFYSSFTVYFGLILLAVVPICWRLITRGWMNFRVSVLSRAERLARTQLKLAILMFLTFVEGVIHLSLISEKFALQMLYRASGTQIDWFLFSKMEAGYVFMALIMILLARQGLRKMPTATSASVGRGSAEP